MSVDAILIQNNFTNNVNQIFVFDESHSIANPLCDIMMENSTKCEAASYEKKDSGVKFMIRAVPGCSATLVFRESVETLILQLEDYIKNFELEFNKLMLEFYTSNDVGPMTNFMLSCLESKIIDIMSEK